MMYVEINLSDDQKRKDCYLIWIKKPRRSIGLKLSEALALRDILNEVLPGVEAFITNTEPDRTLSLANEQEYTRDKNLGDDNLA